MKADIQTLYVKYVTNTTSRPLTPQVTTEMVNFISVRNEFTHRP
jgi:hypothetical protein